MLLTTNWQAHDNYQYGFTTGDSRHSFMQLKVKHLISGIIVDQSLNPNNQKQLLNWKIYEKVVIADVNDSPPVLVEVIFEHYAEFWWQLIHL